MPEGPVQNFANHTRRLPIFHFFVLPVTLLYAFYQIYTAIRNPATRLLPAAMQGDIPRITREQFVALRFAPDDELPDLFRRTVAGEFPKPKNIKQAVKNWRADWLRA